MDHKTETLLNFKIKTSAWPAGAYLLLDFNDILSVHCTECNDSRAYCWVYNLHAVTCGLTACTPESASGPTLGNEYGKPLHFTVFISVV